MSYSNPMQQSGYATAPPMASAPLSQQGQYNSQGQYNASKVFQQPAPIQPQMGGYQQSPMIGGAPGMGMGMGQPGMGMGQPGMGMGQPGMGMGQPPMMGGMGAPMGGYQQQGYQGGYQQAGGSMMGAPGMGMGQPMMGGMGAPMMGGAPGMGMGGVVSLVKGGNMSLTKAVPNLRQITVGLGWDVRQTPGAPFDLDASIFLLKGDGKVRMPQDLIFYNNKQSVDGSVFHHGDNLTGAGEGDDECISVDLTRVPMDIQKIVCIVSIYEAEQRGQNFGMVSRAFIRVVNGENKQEIVRFDLTEEASMFNAMVFGELYRYNNEWKFRAIGQGVPGGLRACGPMFGITMQ